MRRNRSQRGFIVLIYRLALLAIGVGTVAAAPGASAQDAAAAPQHLGVATCSGSNCHGSPRPFDNSPVQQNESLIWETKDAHQNAYKLLLKPSAKRIAANLGIKDASQAPECLTCHSDYVSEAQRGRRFMLSEGVGCEACHGGSEKWLTPHVSRAVHSENVSLGLIPLEDPATRAKVCLGCHQGSEAKPITHRMMGAGHPPLEFELEFFTGIQPAHFKVDADYRKRKTYVPGGQTWAVGQLMAGRATLDGLAGERFTAKGLTPELMFFDCSSCHHKMRPPRWNPGVGGHDQPGELRLADSSLAMTGLILRSLSSPSAEAWTASLKRLHQGSRESIGKIKESAADLRKLTDASLAEVKARPFSRSDLLKLVIALSSADAMAGDITAAKQIYYALDALSRNLQQEMQVPATVFAKPLDAVYAAVDETSQHAYDPAQFLAALQLVKQAAIETQKGAS